jgi:hypothetical protein
MFNFGDKQIIRRWLVYLLRLLRSFVQIIEGLFSFYKNSRSPKYRFYKNKKKKHHTFLSWRLISTKIENIIWNRFVFIHNKLYDYLFVAMETTTIKIVVIFIPKKVSAVYDALVLCSTDKSSQMGILLIFRRKLIECV